MYSLRLRSSFAGTGEARSARLLSVALTDRISLVLLLRRLDSALEVQNQLLQQQNELLARLVDKFAPATVEPEVANPREKSSYSNSDADFAQLEAYAEKIRSDTGKDASEEELLELLAKRD